MEKSKEDKSKDNFEEEFNKERHLEIELMNFTSIDSLYAFHKNRNRGENRIIEESYSLK